MMRSQVGISINNKIDFFLLPFGVSSIIVNAIQK